MNKCNHCICKTCLLAEVNGGAPGCGDCYKCMKGDDYPYHCNSCKEYFNKDEPKGMSLSYIFERMGEELNESPGKFWAELGKAMREDMEENWAKIREEEQNEIQEK